MRLNLIQKKHKGFTLLEVMISLVILSIGLLGVAGMQATGMRTNHAAYNRTVASTMAMDMIDRIRANKKEVSKYTGFDTKGAIPDGPFDCITKDGCNATDLASHDKYEWSQPLISTEKPILPGGQGIIDKVGDTFYITIFWNETHFAGVQRPNLALHTSECQGDTMCLQMEFQI